MKKYTRIITFSLFAVTAIIALVPNSPLLESPGRDSGVYLYIGSSILNGQIPYRDIWDHKPPVVFYLNALGLIIGKGSVWGVWFIQYLALTIAMWTEFILLRRAFGKLPALLGVSVLTSSILGLPAGNISNMVEFYALPVQFAILYLFYTCETKPYHWAKIIAFGVGVAFLFFLRQNLIGIGIAVVLYWTFHAIFSRQWRDYLRKQALFWAGFTAVTAIVFGYFYVVGALDSFWSAAFRYNFLYSSADVTLGMRLTSIFYGLRLLSLTGLTVLMIGGWCLAILSLWKFSQQFTVTEIRLVSIGFLGLPIEVLLSSLSGRSYPHYFLAWLPVASIIVAFILKVLLTSEQDSKSLAGLTAKKALPVCLIIGMVIPPLGKQYFEAAWRTLDESAPSNSLVVSFIRSNTQQNEPVLMWGAETVYNFLAERRSPTRFVYQYPLYRRGYQSAELVSDFLDDLMKDCPALIIDSSPSNSAIPPLDPQTRKEWESGDWAYQVLPEMEQVFEYIETHYTLAGTVASPRGEWPVYSLTRDAAIRCPINHD